MMVSAAAHAADHRDLFPFLIDLPGWDAGEPTGVTVTTGTSARTVTAEREYTKGDKRLHVVILSGDMAGPVTVYFSPQFNLMISTGAGKDLVVRSLAVKGRPARVFIDRANRSINLYILLSRTLEPGRAVFMGFSFENVGYNEAISIVNRFPIHRASRIAGRL